MYRNTFKGQWENLCSDFYADYDMLFRNGEAPACFDDWYKNRVYRWRSAAYSEGVLLDQLGNAPFAETLRKNLEQFRFQKVKPGKAPSAAMAPIAGLLCGVLLGIGLRYLLRWSGIRALLCAIAAAVAITGFLGRRAESDAKKIRQDLRDAYVSQLNGYWPMLARVFDRCQIP